MKISKKQLQNTIMIVIVVITMVAFSSWVKHKILKTEVAINQNSIEKADINLTPRPIEKLFASDFVDIEDEAAQDTSKCNDKNIINDIEKGREEGRIKGAGKFAIGDNCWRTYENDFFKFSFRDLNDTVRVYKESNNAVDLFCNYIDSEGKPRLGCFTISIKSKADNNLASNTCTSWTDMGLTHSRPEKEIDYNKVMTNGRWNYLDILRNYNNCNIRFFYFDNFINQFGTKIEKSYYGSFDNPPKISMRYYFIDIPNQDYFIVIRGEEDYRMMDMLKTIIIK